MYLDPGSISYLVQFLIAGFVAAMVWCKSLREWVAGIFKRSSSRERDEER